MAHKREDRACVECSPGQYNVNPLHVIGSISTIARDGVRMTGFWKPSGRLFQYQNLVVQIASRQRG